MPSDRLQMLDELTLLDGRLLIGLDGWMDGGSVSTGVIETMVRALDPTRVATIDPEHFCIYNFPGSMEVAALFRPHTEISNGLVRAYEPPENVFFGDPTNQLALFSGREPNLHWTEFAECLFEFANRVGVSHIYFIGSVAGAVPHTREPRLSAVVSNASLKPDLEPYGIRWTDYEGPASFVTLLMTQAVAHQVHMATLVAEIPPYIQGTNPKSIESVVRKLAALLGIQLDLDHLRGISDAWEKRVNEAVAQEEELGEHIEKLEHDYDHEVFDTQMGDLKEWLEERGIQVD